MSAERQAQQQRWVGALERSSARLAQIPPPTVAGRLTRMVGLTLEASGCQAAVGDRCEIVTADDTHIDAEVVGFAGTHLFLMPTGDIHGLKPGARVLPRIGTGTILTIGVISTVSGARSVPPPPNPLHLIHPLFEKSKLFCQICWEDVFFPSHLAS